jgi:hypothetical protein
MRRAVIDQPGLKIIFLGLLVSIFVGLALRSQMTQSKINDRLRKIIQEVETKNKGKQLNIDFSEAGLLLSDWGFPFPYLYIKNIKISSTAPECIDNQIYIESLDIPFSWFNLFESRENQVDTVRAGAVELRLDNPDKCFAEVKSLPPVEVENHGKSQASGEKGKMSPTVAGPERIFNVYIEKLKIVDKYNYNIPVLLQTVGLKIGLEKNKLQSIDLKSQLYLFREFESSLYKFKSDFNLNYERNSEGPIKSSALIRGKLIDKPFEINFVYEPASEKIKINHALQDLSVKALLALTNKQNIRAQSQLDGVSGLSISSRGEGEYSLRDKALSFYKITDVLLSSGENSISAGGITIISLKPLKFEPFKVFMHDFDLEKIKNIPAFQSIQKSVYDFGQISGIISVNSETDILAEGFIKDIQFIFSNRGQRAYQKIDELFYKATPQALVISQIKLEGQPADGEIQINYNSKAVTPLPKLQMQAEVKNVKMNESVYNIFSFNQTKPTTISLSLHTHGAQVKSKLRIDQLASEAMEIKQLELGYLAQIGATDGRLHDSVFDLSVKNLKILRSETIDDSFYAVLEYLDHTVSRDDANRPTDFYFELIKASYAKKSQGEVVLSVGAHYFSRIRNEKSNLRLKSEFTNPARSVFDIELLDHGKMVQKFSVNADLGQYTFDIKK